MPFHVTPASNLPAILAEGLQPSIGPRSALLGESRPAVYLFQERADVENALMGWLGDELDEEEVAIIQLSALECWHPAEAERGQGADFELVILMQRHSRTATGARAGQGGSWLPAGSDRKPG